jgi:large subunit ribosomal protein L30
MLAVIRIRGSTGIRPSAQKTAELLRLHKINHLSLVSEDEISKGMLKQVKDYATWGEVNEKTLELLLKNRMLFKGRKKVPEKELKEKTGYSTYKQLSKALISGKVKYKDIADVVPVIRLNPPYQGYEAVRKSFQSGGSSGYRGEKINELIRRMITPGVDLNGKDKDEKV